MQEGKWYQTVLMAQTTRLSNDEESLLLDKNYVDWAGLHSDVLLSIAAHRATSLNNAPPRSKMLTASKLRIFDQFQGKWFPNSIANDPVKQKRWRAALRALAIDFCRIMERGALHDGRLLNEVIADILANDWNPHNNTHAETIYYIAGAILQTIARPDKSPPSALFGAFFMS